MIDYKEYSPSPALAPFIECYWSLNSHSKYFVEKELVVPGGRAELLFNTGDAFQWYHPEDADKCKLHTGSLLLGPRDRFYFLTFTGNISVFSVRFKAGGLAPFLQVPIHEISNSISQQKHVFRKYQDNWNELLNSKLTDEDKIHFVEKELLRKFQVPGNAFQQTLHSIEFIKKAEANTIDEVCRHTGLYYKKLERQFLQFTGYTPKTFSGICRFYKSLQLANGDASSLTHIGIECGYYDQAHFIREFKKYSGITPSDMQSKGMQFQKFLVKPLAV